MKLKITAIGNSAGVILPKELLARLRLEKKATSCLPSKHPTAFG